jgi:hypothetical protein
MIIARQELFDACQILFGTELELSNEFLDYIQESGLKSAYRKKAFETHPDTIIGQDKPDNIKNCADMFLQVQQAYENLTKFIDARSKGLYRPVDTNFSRTDNYRKTSYKYKRKQKTKKNPRAAKSTSQAQQATQNPYNFNTQKRKTSSFKNSKHKNSRDYSKERKTRNKCNEQNTVDCLYKGDIPNRKLLLGHYLYYSGLINWRTIIQALVWQRLQRPKIGELGSRLGWLKTKDIIKILKQRQATVPFGKTAIDLGLLTPQQLNMLIFRQKRLQKKFGEFFLEKNILSAEKLAELIIKCEEHNLNFQQIIKQNTQL